MTKKLCESTIFLETIVDGRRRIKKARVREADSVDFNFNQTCV
jgi:hypothetical protein